MSMKARSRVSVALAATVVATIVALTAAPFVLATTFIGDDHLFLAFSRHVPNPLVAFVRDHHGGEFYRPIPMTLWWVLGRLGGGAALPFALGALVMHVVVAAEVAVLLVAMGEDPRPAWLAAALFFLAPQTLEAAYWFSASTDLLAAAAVLASLILLARGRGGWSALFAAVAYLCKEAALALPLLAIVVLWPRDRDEGGGWRRVPWLRLAPHVALAAVFLLVRWFVLRGWGGAADERAGLAGKLFQLASGLVHAPTGSAVLPEPVAWIVGCSSLALALLYVARSRRRGDGLVWLPLGFAVCALVPLFGAGWAVGARYFYLPTVGLAWLFGRCLTGSPPAAQALVVAALLGLGQAQAAFRRPDIASYQARLAAARRAVTEGVRQGHTIFHIASGIKDLDLAVKEEPELRPFESRLLILGDVPASFVLMPSALEDATRFLVASPPLPPGGAYRFGAHRIVGLPRRGDEPTLDEVVTHLPDIRFIRLRPSPGGRIVARDVTQQLKQTLD